MPPQHKGSIPVVSVHPCHHLFRDNRIELVVSQHLRPHRRPLRHERPGLDLDCPRVHSLAPSLYHRGTEHGGNKLRRNCLSRVFPSSSTSTVSPLSGLLISTRSPGTKLTTFSWSGLSASLVAIEMKSSSTSILVMIVASLIDSMSSLGTSATEDRVLASKSQSNAFLSPYASRTSSSPSWS